MNGRVVWRGPSRIDGSPITVVLTGLERASANGKTGPMVQAWYLPAGGWSGDHRAVCGTCPLLSACYVGPRAPSSVWRAYGHRPVEPIPARLPFGLRLGAWGDPCAAPLELTRDLVRAAQFHTGYTHRWRRGNQRFRPFLMASVETVEDAARAHSMGWRTYRVTPELETAPGEIVCPATARGVTCAECRLCDGAGPGRETVRSITNPAHGYRVNAARAAVAGAGK